MNPSKSDKKNIEESKELKEILKHSLPKILVVGVGGAGNNTVSRLMNENVNGITTIAVNTDAQDLYYCDAHKKVLIGHKLTGGLGAGNDPEIGEAAALESEEELLNIVSDADLVFITCGLGGGTGTGAAPIIAELAKKSGALTVSVCTLPFRAEGEKRLKNAFRGLDRIIKASNTIIPIPNEKLLQLAPNMSLVDAFRAADEILIRGVQGIAELITTPGLVNLDFADVRAVLEFGGFAMIGIGEGEGEKRAEIAVKRAFNNPLISTSFSQSKGALINITGNRSLKLSEADFVVKAVSSKMPRNAEIIWGAIINPTLHTQLKVTMVVSGIDTTAEIVSEESLK